MIYLPDWLPDSLELKSGEELFLVEYSIRAQLTPAAPTDLVTDMRLPKRFNQISKYRGSRTLTVYSKPHPQASIEVKLEIEVSIGGVMGFGASKSMTEVRLT